MSVHILHHCFRLDTDHTSYVMHTKVNGYLNHCYYGPLIADDEENWDDPEHFSGLSFNPYQNEDDKLCDTRNLAMQECSTHALGDYRVSSVIIRDRSGVNTTDPQYVSARKYAGRPEFQELPCARLNGADNIETLEITLKDPATQVVFLLNYTVFPEEDVIVRSMTIRNDSPSPVTMERAMSATLDLPRMDFDLIHTPGAYYRERYGISRNPLQQGMNGFFSSRNSSGHDFNPAFALADHCATEDHGNVYGFLLVYSGSFSVEIEADPYFRTRVVCGIRPEDFEWELQSGNKFQTPELFLTYTDSGFNRMSRNFHNMLRDHLINPVWAHKERPVLLNNWEGTGMNFTKEKLLAIAEEAAEFGLDMFVLDDGWFGHRDDDRSSLGDWFPNEKKVGSLPALVREINRKGLKFGLWFEPEMISKDSLLFQQHPEWVFTVPGREPTLGRHQICLNMGLPEVVDHIYHMIHKVLSSAPIVYMKWDMNRQPAEISSALLPPDRQKECSHRYVLGVYELHRRILEAFPDLLIEGCSGGGGRFDAGILYYAPQIWTSDNTSASARLWIQSGTSFFYPASAMGAHVSKNPSDPFSVRAAAAMTGTFGYEFDPAALTQEEKNAIPEQLNCFRSIRHLVLNGDFYRLNDPWEGDGVLTAWEHVSRDASEAFVSVFKSRHVPCYGLRFVCLRGLDPESRYRLQGTGEIHSGAYLMNHGLSPVLSGAWESNAVLWHFRKTLFPILHDKVKRQLSCP